jgi:ketosteroid isomerase-like protein
MLNIFTCFRNIIPGRLILPGIFFFISVSAIAQNNKDEKEILKILDNQTQAWNRADLDGFMKGYWENDSLMYIGKNGVTYGYAQTLASYKKNYGDTARMGKLSFHILHVNRLSPEYYQVVGQWHLKRSAGDVGGHYTLLFRKIHGQWVIISDHSS